MGASARRSWRELYDVNRAPEMEESKGQETVNKEEKESTVNQEAESTSEAMSDAGSVNKETEARYNRLKLFNRVLQRSLEKVIEHAR